jgi:hypothetical protein
MTQCDLMIMIVVSTIWLKQDVAILQGWILQQYKDWSRADQNLVH